MIAVVFGNAICTSTAPPPGSTKSSRSGATSRSHPGCPCGSSSDNGSDTVEKPITCATRASDGMPVPRERSVERAHGSVSASSTLLPPEPAQPEPLLATAARHVGASSPRYGDVAAPPPRNEPLTARSPLVSIASDCTMVGVKTLPPVTLPCAVPSTDHEEPYHRAMWPGGSQSSKAPPTARSPFGSRANARTCAKGWLPSGAHCAPFHCAITGIGAPPAVAKEPAATMAPSGISARQGTLDS